MNFMNLNFTDDEKLYRAVWPKSKRPNYWTKSGKLSSAAFKDKNGLSVLRTGDRNEADALQEAIKKLKGYIVSVNVKQCKEVEAFLRHLPGKISYYHSEIHGSDKEKVLSTSQALKLANLAKIEFERDDE